MLWNFLGEYIFLINLSVFNSYTQFLIFQFLIATEENLHVGEGKYLSVQISPEEMNILLYVKIPGGRFQTREGYSVAGTKFSKVAGRTIQKDGKTEHDDGTVLF